MSTNTDLSERASESKKTVGRSVAINGVHAVDLELKQTQNLNDPIVDINLKLNNPIGRLWLAIKRIWKSQNTIISLRFTIPLLVLPIAIYVLYVLWQGRGMNIPISKLGIIHQVKIDGVSRDILILPTSDTYLIEYANNFIPSTRLIEKPVIVVGIYSASGNTLKVESLIPYSQLDLPSHQIIDIPPKSVWDTIWNFVSQFK